MSGEVRCGPLNLRSLHPPQSPVQYQASLLSRLNAGRSNDMRRLAGTLLKAASSLTKRHFFQLLHAIRLYGESTLTKFNFLEFH